MKQVRKLISVATIRQTTEKSIEQVLRKRALLSRNRSLADNHGVARR